jgi:hypothetical protein
MTVPMLFLRGKKGKEFLLTLNSAYFTNIDGFSKLIGAHSGVVG